MHSLLDLDPERLLKVTRRQQYKSSATDNWPMYNGILDVRTFPNDMEHCKGCLQQTSFLLQFLTSVIESFPCKTTNRFSYYIQHHNYQMINFILNTFYFTQ